MEENSFPMNPLSGEIESGIEIPPNPRKSAKTQEVVEAMKVGDSYAPLCDNQVHRLRQAINKRYGSGAAVSRRVRKNGKAYHRLWRVK